MRLSSNWCSLPCWHLSTDFGSCLLWSSGNSTKRPRLKRCSLQTGEIWMSKCRWCLTSESMTLWKGWFPLARPCRWEGSWGRNFCRICLLYRGWWTTSGSTNWSAITPPEVSLSDQSGWEIFWPPIHLSFRFARPPVELNRTLQFQHFWSSLLTFSLSRSLPNQSAQHDDKCEQVWSCWDRVSFGPGW